MTYNTNKYDEAFISNNSTRVNYKKFHNWFQKQQKSELSKKQIDALNFFEKTGVTFKVYSDTENKENLIPFDIIPRILNHKEWNKIVKGITQRVLAINFFLNDIYNEQKIKGSILLSGAVLSSLAHLDFANKYKNHNGENSSQKEQYLKQRNRYGWWVLIIYFYINNETNNQSFKGQIT